MVRILILALALSGCATMQVDIVSRDRLAINSGLDWNAWVEGEVIREEAPPDGNWHFGLRFEKDQCTTWWLSYCVEPTAKIAW